MLSLRDPEGEVFQENDRIFRVVEGKASSRLLRLMTSAVFDELVKNRTLVDTVLASDAQDTEKNSVFQKYGTGSRVFEHRRIAYPSYPFEWHPLMLADAGITTMEIARSVAAEGYTLKDATPYNILFDGAQPILVDALSIEERERGYPYWLAEGQFIRTFLLPLLAYSLAGMTPKAIFLASREGLEAKDVRPMAGASALLRLSYWLYVLLPDLLQKGHAHLSSAYKREAKTDEQRANFIYQSTLERLLKATVRLRAEMQPKPSRWSAYTDERGHYTEVMLAKKRELVGRLLGSDRPRHVLDIGANTGEFSELAAAAGSAVVAIESDMDSVGQIYSRARDSKLNIVPLSMNYAYPSPGTGWQGMETLSFGARFHKKFDCVLMLAVIHHLVITEAIPIEMLIEEIAKTTNNILLIEHVAPTDPMCQVLVRGREFLASPLQQEVFEGVLRQHFSIEQVTPLESSTRKLYLCKKKS